MSTLDIKYVLRIIFKDVWLEDWHIRIHSN